MAHVLIEPFDLLSHHFKSIPKRKPLHAFAGNTLDASKLQLRDRFGDLFGVVFARFICSYNRARESFFALVCGRTRLE